jgi:hypothetical protein
MTASCPGRPHARLAHLSDQVLEATGGEDEQHPAAGGADREAVRDVSWAIGVVARVGLDLGVADLEGGVAVAPSASPSASKR